MELTKYKLGDIAEITSSKRIFESEYCESGIPFIRGQEISNESIASTTSKFECYISVERYNELKSKYGVPNKNDILITAVGTIGNVYLVEDNKKFYFKDGNIIWFKNIKNVVCPEFLLYFMKSPIFKQQINRSLIGAVQKALTIVMLAEIQISLPPLSVQKNIASILSAYDRQIALNRAINQNLEALAKQIYDYWFVQFDFPNEEGEPYKSSGGKMVWNEKLKREIPEGWEICKIKDCATTYSGGTPLSSKKEYYEDGNIPWINSGELNNSFITSTSNYISKQGLDNSSAKLYPDNTILVALYGATAGKVSLLTFEACSNQAVCGVIMNASNMINYTRLFLSSMLDYFVLLSTGSARDNISQDTIKNTWILKPEEKILTSFNQLIENTTHKVIANQKETENLIKQRDELLPLLMNGQVTID